LIPEAGSVRRQSRAALIAAGAIFLINFALLAGSLGDYRVTIDSAYHVSIARQWGEHWIVPWDTINFAPGGRPNLQGPLFQAAIGNLGWLLGGTGNDYVMANAIAALAQWTAAIAAAGFFALQLCGEWAGLAALSLLSGAAFASASFAVGIPSGWLFIFSGWAAWFFVHKRIGWAAIFTLLAIYVHVAGFAMAPVTIIVAAILTGRWRELMAVGAITAIVTAPYAIFLLDHLHWFTAAQGYAALLLDPLLDLLGVLGALMALRQPRRNAFLLAWLIGPLVWLAHDPARLVLQWALPASVAAGLLIARAMNSISDRRRALVLGWGVVALATLFPLGIPAVAPEISWDAGLRYPRGVDWNQAQRLAHKIERAGLNKRLISDYQPALCPALAVFAPIKCDKGHWIEVQPRHDPADDLPAAAKAYILPMPSDDPVLVGMERRGWIAAHGSAAANTLVTLIANPPEDAVAPAVVAVMVQEMKWLGRNAINNTIEFDNWRSVISPRLQHHRQRALTAQRISAGRIELTCLLYADSIGPNDPAKARELRWIARGFGVMASFLSDGFAIDYLTEQRLAAFKGDLSRLARQTSESGARAPDPRLVAGLQAAIANALDTYGDLFVERPRGNLFPWLK